jgi:quinol monooxygenase YgiN
MSSATEDGQDNHAVTHAVTHAKEPPMVIVAGHLIVDPEHRDTYLSGCRAVVEEARQAPGCLDFSVTADLLQADRVVIFERWESQNAVDAFRGSGPSEEQIADITSASVTEYDVSGARRLT